VEGSIFFGFCLAMAGLVIGLFVAWIINAYSGATAVVPGKLGMIIAGVLGLLGILIVLILPGISRDWNPIPTLLGITSGIVVPLAAGNILRLNYRERMADVTTSHRWKWGRLLPGAFILLVAILTIADPTNPSPTATPAEKFARMYGVIPVWILAAGGGLWLIRSGTRRPDPDAPYPFA
jgi:hypothetical protein